MVGKEFPKSHLEKRVRPHRVFSHSQKSQSYILGKKKNEADIRGKKKTGRAREESNGKKTKSSKGLRVFASCTFMGV